MNNDIKEQNNEITKDINNSQVEKIEILGTLTAEQRIIIEAIKKIKNPFVMISVEDVMKDLNICRTIAYRVFQREDFPSISIGKSNQVMLLPYLIWKMTKRL